MAISPDGATLASEHDGIVKLWEVATGTNTATLEGRPGHHRFRSVAFSPPDGQSLAVVSGDSTVKLWDLATGTDYANLEHDSQVTSVAYSPDGTSLASTSGQVVTLWDPASGAPTAVLEGHAHWVGAVAFSPDGATLAVPVGVGRPCQALGRGDPSDRRQHREYQGRQRHGLLTRRGHARLRLRTPCQALGRGYKGPDRLPRAQRLGPRRRLLTRRRNSRHRNIEGDRGVGCFRVAAAPSP